MPYLLELFESLSVRACSSWVFPAIKSISSANLRFDIERPPIDMDEVWLFCISPIISSRNTLNITGDRRHPRHSPTIFLNVLPCMLFIRTALV